MHFSTNLLTKQLPKLYRLDLASSGQWPSKTNPSGGGLMETFPPVVPSTADGIQTRSTFGPPGLSWGHVPTLSAAAV